MPQKTYPVQGSSSKNSVWFLLFLTIAGPPVLYIALSAYLTIFPPARLVVEFMFTSYPFLLFFALYMGLPPLFLQKQLRAVARYRSSGNAEDRDAAACAVPRFAYSLLAVLIAGSIVGPNMIVLTAIRPALSYTASEAFHVSGLRYVAALFAGPATILLAAIPLMLNTVGSLEKHMTFIGIPKEIFSLKQKLALGFVFAPLVVVSLFGSLIFMVMENLNVGGVVSIPVLIRMVFVLGGLSLAMMILNLRTVRRQTVDPIAGMTVQLNGMFRGLETGESADLTSRLYVRTYDEVKQLGGTLNSFFDALSGVLGAASGAVHTSSEGASGIVTTMNRQGERLSELRAVSDALRSSSDSLDEQVSRTDQQAGDLKEFSEQVDELVSEQASAMEESAASVRQMAGSLNRIAEQLHERLTRMQGIVKYSDEGEDQMREAVESMQATSQMTEAMLETIDVINGISKQTDLLSMNAAIEAAHAGEAGSGFAVVAEEIRRLSEDVADNTRNVARILRDVAGRITSNVESMTNSGTTFSRIRTEIGDLFSEMGDMNDQTQQMSAGTRELDAVLTRVQDLTGEVQRSSVDLSSRMQALKALANGLAGISHEVRDKSGSVQAVAAELETVTSELISIGESNQAVAEELDAHMSRFVVG